ncbi:MAG: hypothetical protein Q4D81_05150 [Eubacteriales bacterium]|nr:hypothetical protein [Eubacteriales bacterium]
MKDTEMTLLSQAAYDRATDEMTTVEEAIRFLEEELPVRSIWSRIEKFGKKRSGKALEDFLVDGICRNHPEKTRDNVRRTVQSWNSTEHYFILKENAIELAFILGLDSEEADRFVTLTAGDGLHYRSEKEIVYIYALRNKLSYEDANNLSVRMSTYLKNTGDKAKEDLHLSDFTVFLRPKVEKLKSEEELREFLLNEQDKIGSMHNMAYVMFDAMMRILLEGNTEETVDETAIAKKEKERQMQKQAESRARKRKEKAGDGNAVKGGADSPGKGRIKPGPGRPEEMEEPWNDEDRVYTVRSVLKKYLFENTVREARDISLQTQKLAGRGIIPKEKQYVLSEIQKAVCSAWPSAPEISKMRSRRIKVTRKILILLFLVTGTAESGDFEEGDLSALDKYLNISQKPRRRKTIRKRNPGMNPGQNTGGTESAGSAFHEDEEEYIPEYTGETAPGRMFSEADREDFLERKDSMDYMLSLCGFGELDPRNPFDWIILYCMCAGDILEMDERMKNLFYRMFEDAKEYRPEVSAT